MRENNGAAGALLKTFSGFRKDRRLGRSFCFCLFVYVRFWSLANIAVLHCICPLMAQSGHGLLHCKCPLSGVKRTLSERSIGAPSSRSSPIDHDGNPSMIFRLKTEPVSGPAARAKRHRYVCRVSPGVHGEAGATALLLSLDEYATTATRHCQPR